MNGENDEETWLTNWEKQCTNAIQEQPDYEQQLMAECDSSHTRIWNSFQDSATAVAQLYRDRFSEPAAIWVQFQTAAGTVTTLYKESCEGIKKTSELAKQSGYQKRNNELMNWAKRKCRLIPREDLLAYLSGKPPPPTRQNHHHHHHHHSHHRLSPGPRNMSPPPGNVPVLPTDSPDPNMLTFREALARSPISRVSRSGDLCAFINGEMARHCKRPASPSDVTMGSPTQQKRPRYM
ncbi:telomere attrition and p53 response 1 protein [Aethina tumida]|uniref:telomere attrition and p53 response 1 protein n=1 Tax=Aethina tumida TaxID=116153 RepID=UPI00096B5DF9|nr:telomere attrition and p53 response 1 protein [Aethina tumida]